MKTSWVFDIANGAVSILNQNGHWHKKLNRGILDPLELKNAVSVAWCPSLKCRQTAYGNAHCDVAQMARAAVLYTVCCGFKSHRHNSVKLCCLFTGGLCFG